MKINLLTICAFVLFNISSYGQNDNKGKAEADALVALWNTGFNSDDPKNMEKILTESVKMMSGAEYFTGKDTVMNQFVIKRMPVISDLYAVNEFFYVTRDMIYTAGRYSLKVARKNGSMDKANGNFTFTWIKQKDNSFKLDFIHLELIPKK